MSNPIEKVIEIPGFSIAVKIWNPEASQRVLCLHGKLDGAASFDLLAPYLPQLQLVAVDSPGLGLSSSYPEGVLPYWKNDAFLMLQITQALGWEHYDIIAHSLGALLATTMVMAKPQQVGKLVFLDILGPTVNFIEQQTTYLPRDFETYLNHHHYSKTIFDDQEAAIRDRMKSGHISYNASKTLAQRGTKKTEAGWIWTFDPRLHCVSSTLPHEDELNAMFRAIDVPVCLIRAKQGVPYPEDVFNKRAQSIKNLVIHEVDSGHHVHMDDPEPVAKIITGFI